MNKHSTTTGAYPELLKQLFELIQAHRGAFRQGRPFARAWAMVIAEIISFGRHTVTQSLLSLGLSETDWSAWYRLFSRPRYDEEEMGRCLLRETLTAVPEEDLYVVGADGTQIPRSSRKMPGTGWLKAPRTPIFKTGIHRAQRFLQSPERRRCDVARSRPLVLSARRHTRPHVALRVAPRKERGAIDRQRRRHLGQPVPRPLQPHAQRLPRPRSAAGRRGRA